MSGWVEKRTIDGMEFYLNEKTREVSWQKPEALMTAEEKQDESAKWTWVPHKDRMWQPAKIVKEDSDSTVHVQLETGELLMIPPNRMLQGKITGDRKQNVPLWELKKSNLRFLEDDLVMLDPVNEAFIINNLQRRYESGQIYTWVGEGKSVLVSVNPYKEMNLYNDDQIFIHRNKPPNKALPPHVFDIANESYDAMAFKGVNQSVLISGESGAGKTEATKQCLKFLAHVAGSAGNIEDKVLVANPLLEAFGNAKTIRNINSSRFGKWMEVYFDKKTTAMVGSKIINYLLERSRVVYQQKDERNYHIFYALFKDSATKSKFNLTVPEDYHYLSQSGCVDVKEFNDAQNFKDVMSAMKTLGFSAQEIDNTLRLTVAVLLLGNMEFESDMKDGSVDGAKIKTKDILDEVAKLLEIPSDTVSRVLTYRTISAGAKGDKATIPLNKTDSRTASDSLAMGVYGKLFQWMVDRVNNSLGDQDREKNRFLGILDIFGFEIFENNSFEQLCINYANEKLQQLFNNTTFKEEQQLYESEGIPYTPIHFIDNQAVLDMIESEPRGILPVLDDEIKIPDGEDKKFMNKIEDYHGGKEQFMTDPKRRFNNILSFEIVHYAGIVKYDASKFMEKNVDTIFGDMHDALASSKNALLVSIFENADKRIRTLSKQFRLQLEALMVVLKKTESRFIRCIKPNSVMSPNQFVAAMCVEQLKYSGVFEAVNIRKIGYPFRYTHKRFVFRYSCINPNHKYQSIKTLEDDPIPYVKEILKASKQNFDGVQIGKTMVLYRANEYKLLQLLRNLALETLIPIGQSVIRAGALRAFTKILRKAELAVEDALEKANDYEMVTKALEQTEKCFTMEQARLYKYKPYNIAVAKKLQQELKYWLDVEQRMAKLAKVEDPNPLYEQLKKIDEEVTNSLEKQDAASKNASKDYYGRLSYRKPKLTAAQEALREKMKELILKCVLGILDKDVKSALNSMNREKLIECLERADELKHDTDDIRKARELIDKMETMDTDALRAIKCVSKSMLEEVLAVADELKQNNKLIQDARSVFSLPEKQFVEREFERAKEVGDKERQIHREIRLMEIKYDEADAKRFSIENVPGLRTRMDYAKAPKAQETMLTFEKKIKNTLVKPAAENNEPKTPEDKARIKEFKKASGVIFNSILMYMGDKKSKDRNIAASEILSRGVNAARSKDNEMLKEIYMLIIKQLRNNPSEVSFKPEDDARTPTENGTSFQNGLSLLGMCLSCFPPSTEPFSHTKTTFDDYVAIFISNNASFGGKKNMKKYMSALHNTKYSPLKSSAPEPSSLVRQFAQTTGNFSIDVSADSGPKSDKIALYEKESEAVKSQE